MMIVDRRAAHCANSDQRQAVPARDERGPALAAASVARSGQAKVDANASVPPLWTTLDSVGSSREMTASLRETTVGDGDSAGAVFRIVHMHRDVVACSMPTTEQIRALVVSRGSSSDRYAAEGERGACAFAQEREPGAPLPDDRSITNAITAPRVAG
jgi:hypothetical protein